MDRTSYKPGEMRGTPDPRLPKTGELGSWEPEKETGEKGKGDLRSRGETKDPARA